MGRRGGSQHAATLAQSTRDSYAAAYRGQIVERLGDVPIGEITVSMLREWQVELLGRGVGPATIHKCRTVLSSILRHAAESESIAGNPVSLLRAPKASHRDAVQPLSPLQVEFVRAALLDPPRQEVAASREGQRKRASYLLPPAGDAQSRAPSCADRLADGLRGPAAR